MPNTYLSSPMTWSEIRERYPSQEVDLKNPRGKWRAFTTAQVVLDLVTHSPVVEGPGFTFDTRDQEPQPTMEVRPRLLRLSVVIDRTSAAWMNLSAEKRAKLEKLANHKTSE